MSGTNIAELFERTIARDYRLARDKKDWLYENGKQIKFRSPGNKSFAFSLDRKESPFPFICGSPLPKIKKICDAIICLTAIQRHYIFIVEKKREWKDDYRLQLSNGKIFCDWMLSLFREHGHFRASEDSVTFIGLLAMHPRKPSDKAPTTHAGEGEQSQIRKPGPHLDKCIHINNQDKIYLQQYIKPRALNRKAQDKTHGDAE